MYTPSFRVKKNGVPILSKENIEIIGENFIRDFCPDALKIPQAINIDDFVELYLGMTIDYQYLSNDGRYLGMTVFNDTDKVIIYDPERNEADYLHADARTVLIDNSLLADTQGHRYRYTMGHERKFACHSIHSISVHLPLTRGIGDRGFSRHCTIGAVSKQPNIEIWFGS